MFVRRSARAGVLPVLALLLALAGCSGDDEIEPKMPESSSAASTSTEASPSPTKPVEPTLPPEAEGNDAAAAEAFVRHYYDYVNYAQATGEVAGLRKLGLRSCAVCAGVADRLEEIYGAGGRIVGGVLTVTRATSREYESKPGQPIVFAVHTVVRNTKQRVIDGPPDLPSSLPASSVRAQFLIANDSTGWHIAEWEPVQ